MRLAFLLSVIALTSGPMASAETYLVLPDGTGDFATIQEAIDASVNGDVVELADGTFRGPGNRDLDYQGKAITVRSRSGSPESCVIDCEGSEGDPRRGFYFHTGELETSVLEAITIQGGYMDHPIDPPWGGGLLCVRTAPLIRNCVLRDNYCDNGGGGLLSAHGSPMLVRCRFEANSAFGEGGGMRCWGGHPVLTECEFLSNEANVGGGLACLGNDVHATDCTFTGNEGSPGALYCWGTTALIEGCFFDSNESPVYGGAVECKAGSPVFRRCTFWRNRGPAGGGAVYCQEAAEPTFLKCTFANNFTMYDAAGLRATEQSHATLAETIIAFGTNGRAIRCASGGSATLSCCDIYGNELGDWEECIEGQFGIDGNISADPLFCDLLDGDFTLSCDSPCAPGQNPPCGLMGAWPAACGASPVELTSWGRVKLLYRTPE